MFKKSLVVVTALSLVLGGTAIYVPDSTQMVYAAAQTDVTYAKSAVDFYKANKFKESIAAADKAINLNALNADAYYYKGLSNAKLKNTLEAKANYEKAAFANPDKYYKLVMAMKMNEATNELSNVVYGIKFTVADDWYYYDMPGFDDVKEVSKTLKKTTKKADFEAAISGGVTIASVYKEDEEGSSSLMAMVEPVYMNKNIKTVDDYIKILSDLLKEGEGFSEITGVETGEINGVPYKAFAVIYSFDGVEITQYYYISLKDKYARVFILTPENDEDLDILETMLKSVKS